MNTENAIVKKELGKESFIERLVSKAESLEDVKKVGEVIINSGFCPEHFKQSKDAVGAVMCIEAGAKLGLTWMQSLSDIYPVKGRIGIMGTAAKAAIFSSGVLESWREFTEGTYPTNEFKHIIISKRKGFPDEFRTEFSIFDASTAGLMQKDIYKKYGKRMIYWRCLGFHATDYYQDVLKGMKTVEELNDYESYEDVTILTPTGKSIKIREDVQEKLKSDSEAITANVTNMIDKKNGNGKGTEEAVRQPIIDPDVMSEGPMKYTEGQLVDMKDEVYNVARTILPAAKYKILESLPGRKSQKKFREAILAYYDGGLDEYITEIIKDSEVAEIPTPEKVMETPVTALPDEPDIMPKAPTNIDATNQINTFNNEGVKVNKIAINMDAIPDVGPTGDRAFQDKYAVFKIMGAAGINPANFNSKISGTELEGKYKDWDGFLLRASIEDIKVLLSK